MFPTMMTPTPMTEEAFKQAVTHGYTEQMQKAIASPVIRKDSTLAKKYRTKEAIANALYHLLGFDEKEDRDGRSLTGWMLRPDQSGVAPLLEEINRRRAQENFDKLDKDKCEAVALVLYLVNENHNINPDSWEKLLSDLIDIEAGDKRTGRVTRLRPSRIRVASHNAVFENQLINTEQEHIALHLNATKTHGKRLKACNIFWDNDFKEPLKPHDLEVLFTAINVAKQNESLSLTGRVRNTATRDAVVRAYFPNAKHITPVAIQTVADSIARLSNASMKNIDLSDAMKVGRINLRECERNSPLWTGEIADVYVGDKVVDGWIFFKWPFIYELAEWLHRIWEVPRELRPDIGYDAETETLFVLMARVIRAIQGNGKTKKYMDVEADLLAKFGRELTRQERRTRIGTIEKILDHWERMRVCTVERKRHKGTLIGFRLDIPTMMRPPISADGAYLEIAEPFDQSDPNWKRKAINYMRPLVSRKLGSR